MSDGLKKKYDVARLGDRDNKHINCQYFVLDPRHDPSAYTALEVYAFSVRSENPHLAHDIDNWLTAVKLEKEQIAAQDSLFDQVMTTGVGSAVIPGTDIKMTVDYRGPIVSDDTLEQLASHKMCCECFAWTPLNDLCVRDGLRWDMCNACETHLKLEEPKCRLVHTEMCCSAHGTHTSPHVHCILR